MEKPTLKARILLIANEIRAKKDGTNTFSKYDYFTPDGIMTILNPLLQKNGVFSFFTLKKNDNTYTGKLELSDVNEGEPIVYEMESPEIEIKGTNPVQSLGGLQTYLKRYLLMNAFNIADNKDDYDSDTQNTGKHNVSKKGAEKKKFDKAELEKCATKEALTEYFNSLDSKEHTAEVIKLFSERKTAIG